ncbi:MAG: hypothetical protein LUI85_02715 [Bacteroides sp.]|nr:hypothetical protein [Bacteroides sp.]
MKYRVTYTFQHEVSVIVDIRDKKLNNEFAKLGEVHSDEDFKGASDPRWKIEEKAYEEYSGGNCEEGDTTIIDRSIELKDPL